MAHVSQSLVRNSHQVSDFVHDDVSKGSDQVRLGRCLPFNGGAIQSDRVGRSPILTTTHGQGDAFVQAKQPRLVNGRRVLQGHMDVVHLLLHPLRELFYDLGGQLLKAFGGNSHDKTMICGIAFGSWGQIAKVSA